MSAPIHRTVCQLTGEQRSPSRFFAAAGPEADARIAEFEALKAENAALKGSVPEWAQIAHDIGRLVGHYLHHADADHHAALSNLADLLWHSGQYAAAMSRELHHWASAADDADTARREAVEALEVLRDSDIGEVQQRNQELFEDNGRLRARVSRLEAQLAEARAVRDTANAVGAVGGVL